MTLGDHIAIWLAVALLAALIIAYLVLAYLYVVQPTLAHAPSAA